MVVRISIQRPEVFETPTEQHNGDASPNYNDWMAPIGLIQLFDPTYLEHLPISEQLKYYKKRNLEKGKLFKMAQNVWGDRAGSKKRIFHVGGDSEAPPVRAEAPWMAAGFDPFKQEQEIKKAPKPTTTLILDDEYDYFPDQLSSEHFWNKKSRRNLEPLPTEGAVKEAPKLTIGMMKDGKVLDRKEIEKLEEMRKEEEKYNEFKKWYDERVEVRKNLEEMGNVERWFSNKPNMTPLEAMVLQRFLAWKYPPPEPPPPPRLKRPSTPPPDPPFIDRPVPVAMAILEAYLQEHRLRLIDFFTMTDINKDWTMNRDEMARIITWTGLPVSKAELDDFMQYLDSTGDGVLQYKDISRMRDRFIREERAKLREEYGEAGDFLAMERVRKAQEEQERERLRKLQEARDKRKEAVFAAYEGDPELYKLRMYDPRKNKQSDTNPSVSNVIHGKRGKLIERKTTIKRVTTEAEIKEAQEVENNLKKETREQIEPEKSLDTNNQENAPSILQITTQRPKTESDSMARHKRSDIDSARPKTSVTFKAEQNKEPSRGQTVSRELSSVKSHRLRELGESRKQSIVDSRTPTQPSRRSSKASLKSGDLEQNESRSTFLQTPKIDTNECIDQDQELFFTKTKRLRFILKRNKERKRLREDPPLEPVMIRSGDEVVDRHMSYSSRWSPLEVHEKIQEYRQRTWMEYEKCLELCETKGIPFRKKTFQRALLHPQDLPQHKTKKRLKFPGKALDRRHLPHTRRQLRKHYPLGDPRFADDDSAEEEMQETEEEAAAAKSLAEALASLSKDFPVDETPESDLESDDYKVHRPKPHQISDPAHLYPAHKPPSMTAKEPVRLSTGGALVGAKVDCWTTFREFLFHSRQFKRQYRHYTGYVKESACWPGKEQERRRFHMAEPGVEEREASVLFQRKPRERVEYPHKTTVYKEWKR